MDGLWVEGGRRKFETGGKYLPWLSFVSSGWLVGVEMVEDC